MNSQFAQNSPSTHACDMPLCSSDILNTLATITPMRVSSNFFVVTSSKMGMRQPAMATGGLGFFGAGARSIRCCVSRQRC